MSNLILILDCREENFLNLYNDQLYKHSFIQVSTDEGLKGLLDLNKTFEKVL